MPAVKTKLTGFFPPDFTAEGRVLIDLADPGRHFPPTAATPEIAIGDARELQAAAGHSEADFFDQYGFVLLPHRTAVSDWEVDPSRPPAESQVARAYFPEIETLIRTRLLPGEAIAVHQPSPPLRRGRGTSTPQYGDGVHQDFGLTPDDFQEALEAFSTPEVGRFWRERFEHPAVAGLMVIDFWRTTNMTAPLKHMPLAVCDPNTVDMADLVPSGLVGFAPSGRPTNQLSLRFNAGQGWWYYPDMRPDEVLAFKLFEYFKHETRPVLRSCFHSAFKDPGAPHDAEPRQSCEHRVSVIFLRDRSPA